MKKRWIAALLCLTILTGLSLPFDTYARTSSAGATDYAAHVLLLNKYLIRFNDQTRVIYYSVDKLDKLPNWNYKTWDFLKDQVIKEAFDEWEQALQGKVRFQLTRDPNKSDIAIHWRSAFNDKTLLGHAHPEFQGKYLTNADVQITLTQGGKMLDKQSLRAVALHEIGHALGLNGHSPYPGDLMYPTTQAGVHHLSRRDIATIRRIYSTPPSITNPEGVRLAEYRKATQAYEKGVKSYNRKQYNWAYQAFSQADALHPKEPEYAKMAGLCAFQMQEYDEAASYLEKVALKPITDQLMVQYALATALMEQGKSAQQSGKKTNAKQHYKKAAYYFQKVKQNPKVTAQMKLAAESSQQWLQKAIQQ